MMVDLYTCPQCGYVKFLNTSSALVFGIRWPQCDGNMLGDDRPVHEKAKMSYVKSTEL